MLKKCFSAYFVRIFISISKDFPDFFKYYNSFVKKFRC